jgi:glycosyltransferase involved in cell wall biosynthesis
MSARRTPPDAASGGTVSMGMPLFNADRYLEEAIRSLLGQTFDDFELIISDNASTDRTETICRDYAATDPRIRYVRNSENVGFVRNQNRVIELASGEYFLLTHGDDVRASEYLAATVRILEADDDVVIAHCKTRDIDEHGRHLPREDPPLRFDSPNVRDRFVDVIRMDHLCEPDFGLTRTAVLGRTRLHGDYADSDRVLLAELALRGRFRYVPEYLFFRRAHAEQSTAIAPDRHTRTVWYNPGYRGKVVFPYFRQLREYGTAVRRAPLSRSDRLWCYRALIRWCGTNRRLLQHDLDFAARQIVRPYYRALRPRRVNDQSTPPRGS